MGLKFGAGFASSRRRRRPHSGDKWHLAAQRHDGMAGKTNRIDPDLWRPMIMSCRKFYGLTMAQLDDSRLSEIDKSAYVTPDVERARLSPVVSNHKLAA